MQQETNGQQVRPTDLPSGADSDLAVSVSGLEKSYDRLKVLKGIDFAAGRGSVSSIIGASGSGKSTLLRCMNLLERPQAGKLEIAGEEIRFHGAGRSIDPRQVSRLRRRVAMVFQQFALWPHLTVLGNVVEVPVHVQGISRKEATEKAMAYLERVGMAAKADEYPNFLSGGQQQRVGIARALATDPEVLLFDEPTSALDPELVGEVLAVIRGLAEEGRTMILVTHEMRFARDVSSQVAFLHQGQVEEIGTPEQVFENPRSERCQQFLSHVMS
ncbi:amino acid ABC transporter ATP-binding protein [Paracoccus sp. Z330]|uniref:Amino acid ABC transporter ATP-binding protein n=1 Tax=Paracoccus onchidii TaxID=3017813 RepID=A0ABT4ZFY9_9RHOB|nr:amino acid ABC transporter ATP-binding protein [Paracoccus onchidii]MDB6178288.1 amino acid ABC transporter ATP-binding protein [Paracoccus onchidii]